MHDYEILFHSIAMSSKPKNDNSQQWSKCPWGFVKKLSTTAKSDITEKFICDLAHMSGIDIKATRNVSPRDTFDVTILDKPIEIRSATEDVNRCFQFNGEIFNRTNEYFLFLGIGIDGIYFNIYPAIDLQSGKVGNICSMVPGSGKVGSQKLTRKKQELHRIDKFAEIIKSVLQQI